MEVMHFPTTNLKNNLCNYSARLVLSILSTFFSHCGRTHCNTMLCQPLLDLSARHVIIASHLPIYKSVCLYRYLPGSSRMWKIGYGTCELKLFDCSSVIRVTLAKLTSKPSPFDNLNISAGWRPCL